MPHAFINNFAPNFKRDFSRRCKNGGLVVCSHVCHLTAFGKFHEFGVLVGGSKPVGQKSKNDSAEILPLKAENQSAKNMIRPKKYSPILAL